MSQEIPAAVRKLLKLLNSDDPVRDAYFEVIEHVAKSAAFLGQVIYAVPNELDTFHDVAIQRAKDIMKDAIEENGNYNVGLVEMSDMAREMVKAVDECAKELAHSSIKEHMGL